MNLLETVRARFAPALQALVPAENVPAMLELVRKSQDPRFGDYQANMAMPLANQLGKKAREIAESIVAALKLDDMCEPLEIAGPGFINVRLKRTFLEAQLKQASQDPRLGIAKAAKRKTYVIDYSAPNVAKPMHVGHIRSTVIGDALYRTLSFMGHHVIGDNHLGDWGTQFGMIIFGYKHFLNASAYAAAPVDELARLYRLVNRMVEYWQLQEDVPAALKKLDAAQQKLAALPPAADQNKEAKKVRANADRVCASLKESLKELQDKQHAIEQDAPLVAQCLAHSTVRDDVLRETAKLHEGDAENLRLWKEFMPPCREAIEVIYRRLGVTFDQTLGESFYHDQLGSVVEDLLGRGLARQSEGAIAVFLEGFDAPMLIRKRDGAFLYATSDLATIRYRMKTWKPNAILYVVDHRQSLHFEHLFAAAKLWFEHPPELCHVSFGTVLGKDGKPYKTRSGDTVGLSGLLDEAISRAALVVAQNDDKRVGGPQLSSEERDNIAIVVGLGAIKYADLSQNRTSDYEFSYDKMLAMNGNTATYLQYGYARVHGIAAKADIDLEELRSSATPIGLATPAERALGTELLRFTEAMEVMLADYRPHHLTTYLFDLATCLTTFYDQCPVNKAETAELKQSRMLLCDLTARAIKLGLSLLGVGVAERM